jgi:xylan 1,4-beta-xylosidase
MSYWTFTDVFEEAGPPPTPFHGGFGLINLQGLHKPSYYAYKFLHELGDEELECSDANATVCRQDGSVQALLWNYTAPANQDAENNVYFKRDLPPKPVAPVDLSIKNLPPGKYALKVFAIGYRRNDVYTDFLDMGSPANPTRQQIQTLAKKNSGAPMISETVQITNGTAFQRRMEMRENDVYLVTLTPQHD